MAIFKSRLTDADRAQIERLGDAGLMCAADCHKTIRRMSSHRIVDVEAALRWWFAMRERNPWYMRATWRLYCPFMSTFVYPFLSRLMRVHGCNSVFELFGYSEKSVADD